MFVKCFFIALIITIAFFYDAFASFIKSIFYAPLFFYAYYKTLSAHNGDWQAVTAGEVLTHFDGVKKQ